MLPKFDLPIPTHPGYGTIDPLDNRYFDEEVAKYVSEQSRIIYQAYVEAALAHTLAEFGLCSNEIAQEIEKSARAVDIEAVYREEKTTKHDIKALINTIKAHISDEAKPYVHFGATSYDIIANAQVLQLKNVTNDVIIPRLEELIKVLANLAKENAETLQIGRTHGQHGLPITFGFAISEYISRLGNSLLAIKELSNELPGKFSGAVGAYNSLSIFVDDPLKFEQSVLEKIGLKPAEYSTQIAPPEFVIRLIDELAISSGIMANIGHDMRHLQRTEISEIREKFDPGQTGSSTMAHKRNPWNFENVVSLNKQVLSQVMNANLNIASEHQRDLTDSASSRFYVLVPALVANMTSRLTTIMSKIEVDKEAMLRNLALTKGAIAAEPLYLLLEKYGHTAAHEKSKELAHKALEENKRLFEVASTDQSITDFWNKFSDSEKQIIQNPEQNYIGQSAKKTVTVADKWLAELESSR